MKHWIISLALFMAVFVGCLTTIFSPVKAVMATPDYATGRETVIKQPDFVTTARMWRENPNYFVTVGVTGILALGGAFYSVYMLNRVSKDEKSTT